MNRVMFKLMRITLLVSVNGTLPSFDTTVNFHSVKTLVKNTTLLSVMNASCVKLETG